MSRSEQVTKAPGHWATTTSGALEGGSPMSRVDFKKWSCHMSLLFMFYVASKMIACPISNLRNALCRVTIGLAITISPMSHADFRKRPCCRVEFRGQ